MKWMLTNHADPVMCKLADRHYSRKTVGAPQMMPPGRKIVLRTIDGRAGWGTHWPYHELVMHSFGDCWICSFFRNESYLLSSELIIQAEKATMFMYKNSPPDGGFITFINLKKINSQHPGYCYKKAGWEKAGFTKSGLLVLRHEKNKIPNGVMPIGYQLKLFQ